MNQFITKVKTYDRETQEEKITFYEIKARNKMDVTNAILKHNLIAHSDIVIAVYWIYEKTIAVANNLI